LGNTPYDRRPGRSAIGRVLGRRFQVGVDDRVRIGRADRHPGGVARHVRHLPRRSTVDALVERHVVRVDACVDDVRVGRRDLDRCEVSGEQWCHWFPPQFGTPTALNDLAARCRRYDAGRLIAADADQFTAGDPRAQRGEWDVAFRSERVSMVATETRRPGLGGLVGLALAVVGGVVPVLVGSGVAESLIDADRRRIGGRLRPTEPRHPSRTFSDATVLDHGGVLRRRAIAPGHQVVEHLPTDELLDTVLVVGRHRAIPNLDQHLGGQHAITQFPGHVGAENFHHAFERRLEVEGNRHTAGRRRRLGHCPVTVETADLTEVTTKPTMLDQGELFGRRRGPTEHKRVVPVHS